MCHKSTCTCSPGAVLRQYQGSSARHSIEIVWLRRIIFEKLGRHLRATSLPQMNGKPFDYSHPQSFRSASGSCPGRLGCAAGVSLSLSLSLRLCLFLSPGLWARGKLPLSLSLSLSLSLHPAQYPEKPYSEKSSRSALWPRLECLPRARQESASRHRPVVGANDPAVTAGAVRMAEAAVKLRTPGACHCRYSRKFA